MSNLFKTAFVHVLHEQPTPEEMSDSEAMEQSLDKGTDPASFDTAAADDGAADHLMASSKLQASMVGAVNEWINRLSEFSEFLNGTGPESMQSKLKNAVPETLFDKIRIAESKKIARVSMEVTALCEMMKGYSATSNSPKLRGV
jgi:hypothetical protein